MNTTRSIASAALSCFAALVLGCSTAKVTDETAPAVAPAPPDIVYVGSFDLGATTLQQDPGTLTGRPRLLKFPSDDPVQKLQELGELLANDITKDLNDGGLTAQRLAPDATRPPEGWLIRGKFLKVAEGNRLQSAVLGFGIGGSDAKLYVAVADLTQPEGQKLYDFNAESTGNKLPGGGVGTIATHTPYGMVAKFVLERNATEKDISQDAKAIADEILRYAGKKS